MLIESLEKKTNSQCQHRDLRPVLLLCHQAGQRPTAAGVCVGREHPVYGRAQ